MSFKEKLAATVLASMSLSAALVAQEATTSGTATSTPAAAPAAAEPKTEKCWGINKTAKEAACGVGKSDIDATKEVFKKKFAKSATHDCSGSGNCSAAKGNLGWMDVAEGTCISKHKGFLIIEKDGKKVVQKS